MGNHLQKNSMKYLIKPETELYVKCKEIEVRIKNAQKTTQDFVTSFGGQAWVPLHGYYGGCAGIQLDKMPDGWRKVNGRYGVYYPKSCKENKALLENFKNLPTEPHNVFNEVIGFGFYPRGGKEGLVVYRLPGITWDFESSILIEIPDAVMDEYKPVPGMVKLVETVTYTEEPIV